MNLQSAITMQLLAERAIACQDASNLSGLGYSFKYACEKLWEVADDIGKGTNWVNKNPVIILYTYKMASLAGIEPLNCTEEFAAALRKCEEWVQMDQDFYDALVAGGFKSA